MSITLDRINRYNVYCSNEDKYNSVWSKRTPTHCPVNQVHSIDMSKTFIDDQLPIPHIPVSSFDEVRVSERTGVIELKSIYGKSTLRDRYVGNVSNDLGDAEYKLSIETSNDVSGLRSAERGRYVAGLQGEVGIAMRLGQYLSNDQELRIGLFDESNGFYFLYNSNGINTAIRRDTVETITERSNFNVDTMDGTGPSRYLLNPLDGLIYTIRFSWYGYGNIEFRINATNKESEQSTWLANVYNPLSQTSVKTPNLPINVELRNNSTLTPAHAFVAGRQYALLGKYLPIVRVNSSYRTNVTVPSTTVWTPIISIRRKQGYLGNSIKAFAMDIVTTQDLYVQIRVGGALTGPSWGAPRYTEATDTSVEVDQSASAITGGKPVWCSLVSGDRQSAMTGNLEVSFDLSEYDILTIAALGVSATNGAASFVFRWTEEW